MSKTTTINLESRRYIGNKTKLADWIFDKIRKETNGNCKSFFDVFAGTATISKQALKHYEKVIINDLLYANKVIYEGFFGKGKYLPGKLNALLSFYNSLDTNSLEENYFSENFGNKFFDLENAKLIGYIREDLENRKEQLTEREFAILLSTLIYNIDKIANTVGHFDAYIKKDIDKPRLKLKSIQIENHKNVEIHRSDANELVKEISADIAYIDPPYNSRQYNRFYHIYENLVRWQKPELFGVAMKPKAENSSLYCTTKAAATFRDLIENLDAKYIFVSYNNTFKPKSNSSKNKIKLEEIKEILETKGETKVFEKEHRFFNTGKTEFANHKELLFATKTKL